MMSFINRIFTTLTAPLRLLLSPTTLFSSSRRLPRISLPAKVSILLFIFLAIGVTLVRWAIHHNTTNANVDQLWREHWFSMTLLVVAIPVALYFLLKLWLKGEISPYPEIDRAWEAGLVALEQENIDLAQTPLFLVLGSPGEEQEHALSGASRLSLNIEGVPKGPSPLHWYANSQGVYLYFTQPGCLSRLAGMAKGVVDKQGLHPELMQAQPSKGAGGGTMIMDGHLASSPTANVPEPADRNPAGLKGTMDIFGGVGSEGDFDPTAGIPESSALKLDLTDANEQDRQLQYVCHLIRLARLPLAPINGVLTLLPLALIQRSDDEADQVRQAVRRDLDSLLQGLMLRCPAIALVIGMEEEAGFRELVMRVGPKPAAGNRFGKGYSLSSPPLAERMGALCIHACGAFEDLIYVLFAEKGALTRPGNTRLYSLLVTIRRNVQGRLDGILADGFGLDDREGAESESFFFGGCYFAAAGDTEDRQAFVKGIFDKLQDEQEELQWTEVAFRRNQKFRRVTNILYGLTTAMVLLVGVVLVYDWLGKA